MAHPGTREYKNQTVRLADLTVTDDMLEHLRFENCVVIGPAVVAMLTDVALMHCTFDAPGADALVWEIPDQRTVVIGAIGARDVGFYSCRFQRVGFAVTASSYPQFLAELAEPS